MTFWDSLKGRRKSPEPTQQLDNPREVTAEISIILKQKLALSHLPKEMQIAQIRNWPHNTSAARTQIIQELIKVEFPILTFIAEFGIRILDDQAIQLEAINFFSNFVKFGGKIPTQTLCREALNNAYLKMRQQYIYEQGHWTPIHECCFFTLENRRIRKEADQRKAYNMQMIERNIIHPSYAYFAKMHSSPDFCLMANELYPDDQISLEKLCMAIHQIIVLSSSFEEYMRLRENLFRTRRIPYSVFTEAL